jgi:hypothetical protein
VNEPGSVDVSIRNWSLIETVQMRCEIAFVKKMKQWSRPELDCLEIVEGEVYRWKPCNVGGRYGRAL